MGTGKNILHASWGKKYSSIPAFLRRWLYKLAQNNRDPDKAWQVKLKKKKKKKSKNERNKTKLKLAADALEAAEGKRTRNKKKKRKSKQKAGMMEQQQADDWEGAGRGDKEKVAKRKRSKRKITQTEKQINKKRKPTLTCIESAEQAQEVLAAQIQGKDIEQSDMTVRMAQRTEKRKESLMDGKRICSLCCQEIAVDKVNSTNVPTDQFSIPTISLEQSSSINDIVGTPDSRDSSDNENPEDMVIELLDSDNEVTEIQAASEQHHDGHDIETVNIQQTSEAFIEILDSDNEITELEDCGIKKASVQSIVEIALRQNSEKHETNNGEVTLNLQNTCSSIVASHSVNSSEATILDRDIEIPALETSEAGVELPDSDLKTDKDDMSKASTQEDDGKGKDGTDVPKVGTRRPLCDHTTQTVCDQMTCQSGLRCGNCQTKGHIRKNLQCPSYNTRDEMERRVACKEVARKRELRALLVRIREVADAQTDERERLEILQMQETVMSAEMGFQRSIGQIKQIIQKLDQWAWAWGRTGNLSPSEVEKKGEKFRERKKYYPQVV